MSSPIGDFASSTGSNSEGRSVEAPHPGDRPRSILFRSAGGRRTFLIRARRAIALVFCGMLVLSVYGTVVPANARCGLPGAVGCVGGLLGAPTPSANATLEQFFNITMYDYGFWIIDTVYGTNESGTWTIYEGWTVHVNATSLPADKSVGGTAYHGIGVEVNATGKQLLSLSAGVGKRTSASFTAPTKPYYHQHIWCTIECGNGHGGMQVHNLNIVASTLVPSVTVRAAPSTGSAPLSVKLTSNLVGGTSPFNEKWDFGDGTPVDSSPNTTHTYNQSGSYTARLSVVDGAGFQASASASITVKAAAPLTVAAQVTPSSGTAPLEATLNATAAGGVAPYVFSWSLGDGGTVSGADGVHLYSAPGDYAILLTVTDSAGTTASASASVGVHKATGNFPVVAAASPGQGSAPLGVNLSSSASGGTGPYTAVWFFGDGAYGGGLSTSHTYSETGLYEATVFVSDSSGSVGSNATAVAVSGPSGSPFKALVTETPSEGSPPFSINASVSIEGGTQPYTTPSWSFGDGSTGAGPVVEHQFSTLGAFNVTVTVRDSAGHSAKVTTPVLSSGLGLSISVNRSAGDAPFSVGAGASIVGGTGQYGAVSWDWGDGNQSTGSPANHSFAAGVTGPVTIRAEVTDSAGARANSSVTVEILAPPIVQLSVETPSISVVPVTVNFNMTVAGGSGNYSSTPLWSFGDGGTTRGLSPLNHTYLRSGHFHVTVETNDTFGGVGTGEAWVNISGGAADGAQASAPVYTFTGVANPNQAALILMGLVGLSGLVLLYRGQLAKARKSSSATTQKLPVARPAARVEPPTRTMGRR